MSIANQHGSVKNSNPVLGLEPSHPTAVPPQSPPDSPPAADVLDALLALPAGRTRSRAILSYTRTLKADCRRLHVQVLLPKGYRPDHIDVEAVCS